MTITINGFQARTFGVVISLHGFWYATAQVADDIELSGPASIQWGEWQLTGDIDPDSSGRFAEDTTVRIVGGIAWRTLLSSKSYANDAGLTFSAIASDVATRIGAAITVQESAERIIDEMVGTNEDEAASAIIERLKARGSNWWVGLNGLAIVGERETPQLDPLDVTVLDYNPHEGTARLDAVDPSPVLVGGILPQDERLTEARRIVELVASASDERGQILHVRTVAA